MDKAAIAPVRAWNTWRTANPLAMVHLPSGLSLLPCAYSARANNFTDFHAVGADLRLGPRSLSGDSIAARITHAGTALDWLYGKPDPMTISGQWHRVSAGEWGLRFWICLVLRLDPGESGMLADWHYDDAQGLLQASGGGYHAAFAGAAKPLLVTFHDSVEALQDEFTRFGYFYLESRGQSGKVAVLRYNLEEMPDFRFSLSVANDPTVARDAARAACGFHVKSLEYLQEGETTGALDAVRDVVAWNTVFDYVNRRPYMALSRNWVEQKFGGFGIWLNDIFYHAMMGSLFEQDLAVENLRAVLAAKTPEGNLPCLVTGRDQWLDRSQPPVCSLMFWMIYQRCPSEALLDLAWAPLLQNHDWWFSHRDGNGDGLYEWGTSPVGDGLYRGTKLGAKNESSMDNSPIHDAAEFDARSGTLTSADVGLNSLLVLDAEILATFAAMRGEFAIERRLLARAGELRSRIRERLWDERRQVFANRLWQGAFIDSIAPTSFYPLLAGAADERQRAALLRHLADPRKFGGEWRQDGGWPLPSVTRDDPAFSDNVYWRGRIWPPLNYLVYLGLKRAGCFAQADALAESSWRLFERCWRKDRHCPENFNADSGIPDDQPDTDLFYGWGALMPLLGVCRYLDVTPWDGWEINHRPASDWTLGPLRAFGGHIAKLESRSGLLRLTLDGEACFETTLTGRLTEIAIGEGGFSARLPAHAAAIFVFPGRQADTFAAMRYADKDVEPSAVSEKRGADGAFLGTQIALSAGAGGQIALVWRQA